MSVLGFARVSAPPPTAAPDPQVTARTPDLSDHISTSARANRLARAAISSELVAAVLPPVALTAAAGHELLYDHSPWPTWVLVAVVIWPTLWRRRAPTGVFMVCLSSSFILWATKTPSLGEFSLLVTLYTVAAQRSLRQALVAAAVVEAGVILIATRFAPTHSINDALIVLSSLSAAALFLGTTVQAKRGYLATVEDRAQRLERERAQDAQLAAAAERTRIAREMHDIVAHGLSVVISLAEGAAVKSATDPLAARQAMRQVAASGRQSLSEMRKLLDVLRSDSAVGREPQPSLAMLDGLAHDVRSTGLAVTVNTTGDTSSLGEAEQTTVYRIIQEALTNVIKHARGATAATVTLDIKPDRVCFAVEDDGPAGHDNPHPTADGNGLVGMQERAAIFGGTVHAGPISSGWLVHGQFDVTR